MFYEETKLNFHSLADTEYLHMYAKRTSSNLYNHCLQFLKSSKIVKRHSMHAYNVHKAMYVPWVYDVTVFVFQP